jgi:hypothetical protein
LIAQSWLKIAQSCLKKVALSKYKDLRKYRLELRHQTNHAFDDMNAILLLTVDCTKLVKMIGKVKALIKESWSEACIGEVYPLFNFILVILQTLTIQKYIRSHSKI